MALLATSTLELCLVLAGQFVTAAGAVAAAYIASRVKKDTKAINKAVNDVPLNQPDSRTLRETVDEIHSATVDNGTTTDASPSSAEQ